MAKLFGEMKGTRGTVTRCSNSILTTHIRGYLSWLGNKVFADIDENGNEVFEVYQYKGSNNVNNLKHLLTVK